MKFNKMNEIIYRTKWKVVDCGNGKSCWCAKIETDSILEKNKRGNVCTIIDSNSISKEMAEYLVKMHNQRLNNSWT